MDFDDNKHFHRYCQCDADIDNIIETDEFDSEDLGIELDDTSEEFSFESSFERDMLLNFTDLRRQQV